MADGAAIVEGGSVTLNRCRPWGSLLSMALVKVRRLEREELPMIKPTLHHVTIKTSHLEDMINWYALVVGARCNSDTERVPGCLTTMQITGLPF